jgi:hypothetical protein
MLIKTVRIYSKTFYMDTNGNSVDNTCKEINLIETFEKTLCICEGNVFVDYL